MVELGHVALRVNDLDRAVDFYRRAVGLRLAGRIAGGRAALLTGGRQHHELLLVSARGIDPVSPRQPLFHVAWRIGEGLGALRDCKKHLADIGVDVEGAVDHGVSWSLYLRDPEGNQVELFADNPDIDWRSGSSWVEAPSVPISLE